MDEELRRAMSADMLRWADSVQPRDGWTHHYFDMDLPIHSRTALEIELARAEPAWENVARALDPEFHAFLQTQGPRFEGQSIRDVYQLWWAARAQERASMPPEDDGIRILDLPIPDMGIVEVEQEPLAVMPFDRTQPAPPPPSEHHQFEGHDVYARPGHVYYKERQSGNYRTMVMSGYSPIPETGHVLAPSMKVGDTIFWCTTLEELAHLRRTLETIDIKVRPGYNVFYFKLNQPASNLPSVHRGSNVLVAYKDDTLLYLGANYIQRLCLNDPLQGQEAIFKNILGFLTKSVEGVKKTMKGRVTELTVVEDRKAEEVYQYISDIAPPQDKQAMHEMVMAKLQHQYENDSREMATLRNLVRQLSDKVKAARNQLPSGKAGIALRNSFLKADYLKEMLDSLTVKKNGKFLTFAFAFRKDLVLCEDIKYGRPVFTITLCATGGRNRNAGTPLWDVWAQSLDKGSFMHPHINGTSDWCLGTYPVPLYNALVGGNMPLATSLIWEYLSTYNPDSPLVNIDQCRRQQQESLDQTLIVRRR